MAGIYVHIPFCRRRCGYCDFFSSTDTGLLNTVVEAIKEELRREHGFIEGPVRTLYFGGGTPSLCTPEQLQGIVETVREVFVCEFEEVTAEANPDDLAPAYLDALARTDIDRLSIGVQSFVGRDLQLMGRRHTANAATEAVRGAVQRFENVTIDLIFGIPGMTGREWRANLETAISLGVQHISAYHLTLEEGTPFSKTLKPVDEAASERQYETLERLLSGAGYVHYEVSNFAKPGFEAVHNAGYWKGKPYLGVGPSAHSFRWNVRRWNVAGNAAYLRGLASGEYFGTEILTPRDMYNEYVMLSLRTSEGMRREEAIARFGEERWGELRRKAEKFTARGTVVDDGERIFIPSKNFLVSDHVIGELFLE